MTYTYNEKIKKLDLGEFGQYIDEYSCNIEEAFYAIADNNVGIYYSDLFNWAADHIDDIDEELACGGRGIVDIVRNAQYRVFSDDLYTHKDDILLYYAYNYMEKNNIELSDEKLEQLEQYIKTVEIDNKLEDIENYCDELNINK